MFGASGWIPLFSLYFSLLNIEDLGGADTVYLRKTTLNRIPPGFRLEASGFPIYSSKKSPIGLGPTERTPKKLEYLIALKK